MSPAQPTAAHVRRARDARNARRTKPFRIRAARTVPRSNRPPGQGLAFRGRANWPDPPQPGRRARHRAAAHAGAVPPPHSCVGGGGVQPHPSASAFVSGAAQQPTAARAPRCGAVWGGCGGAPGITAVAALCSLTGVSIYIYIWIYPQTQFVLWKGVVGRLDIVG